MLNEEEKKALQNTKKEKVELMEKLSKIDIFLYINREKVEINEKQYNLLKKQQLAMLLYFSFLEERIEDFEDREKIS